MQINIIMMILTRMTMIKTIVKLNIIRVIRINPRLILINIEVRMIKQEWC
jgi:hypothetical protein